MTSSNQNADDESIRQLISDIAKALVDRSDAVDVTLSDNNGSVVANLRVAPEDIGKVIGKQGRTARSLRTVLSASGMKLHKRYVLEIAEEGRFPQVGETND